MLWDFGHRGRGYRAGSIRMVRRTTGMKGPGYDDSRDRVLEDQLLLIIGFEYYRVFVEAFNPT
jgi:hypothetical protein